MTRSHRASRASNLIQRLGHKRFILDFRRLPFQLVVNVLAASPLCPRGLRLLLLRASGMVIGDVSIAARLHCFHSRLVIRDGTFINAECLVDNTGPVSIGANVHLGPRVCLITSTHQVGVTSRRAGEVLALPVTISDGVWLGAGVMVMPGVTIGAGAIVAAGAVVTKDLGGDAVYAGVPARLIRTLPD